MKQKQDISKHPVSVALSPLKAEAVKRANKEALEAIERFKIELAEAGFDLDVYAPLKNAWDLKNYFKRQFAYQLTVNGEWEYGKKQNVRVCPELEARFVKQAEIDAGIQYDAFVYKLVGKVGEVDKAEIEGSHVWGFSILTVTKGEAVERWKTQQIVNVSKHGRLFNQWPSRKQK